MSGVFKFLLKRETVASAREKTSGSTNTHRDGEWMIASILVGKGGGGSARVGGKIEVVTLEREAFEASAGVLSSLFGFVFFFGFFFANASLDSSRKT